MHDEIMACLILTENTAQHQHYNYDEGEFIFIIFKEFIFRSLEKLKKFNRNSKNKFLENNKFTFIMDQPRSETVFNKHYN